MGLDGSRSQRNDTQVTKKVVMWALVLVGAGVVAGFVTGLIRPRHRTIDR